MKRSAAYKACENEGQEKPDTDLGAVVDDDNRVASDWQMFANEMLASDLSARAQRETMCW